MKNYLLVLVVAILLTSCGVQKTSSDNDACKTKVDELKHINAELETYIKEQNHVINTYKTKLEELQPTSGVKH